MDSNLCTALAAAQSKFIAPKKNKHVDFTDKSGRRVKYSYSDLADLIDAVKFALSENGLSFTQTIAFVEGNCCLKTTLMHKAGEVLESIYPLPDPRTQKPQEFGSLLTYSRRYSLSSILGIASDEDDDGQIANDASEKQQRILKPQQKDVLNKPTSRPNGTSIEPKKPTLEVLKESAPPQKKQIDIKEYKVPFGIYQGQTLSEIDPVHLEKFCKYIVDKAKIDGKEIQGTVKEFLDKVDSYFKEIKFYL